MIWHNQILFSMNVARWMKQIKYLLDIECWNWTSRQTINIELSASYAGKHCLFTLFRIISFDLKLLRKYPVFNILLKIYIVVLYLLIYITIGSFMNSKLQVIFNLTRLKPRTDDHVSLDMFLGSFPCSCVRWTSIFSTVFLDKFYLLVCTAEEVFFDLKSRTDDQVFLDKFSALTTFICSCVVRHKLLSFSLTRSLVQSRHNQLLNKAPCQGKIYRLCGALDNWPSTPTLET